VNSERLKEILNRIPIAGVLLVFAAYLLYDYYSFIHGEYQQRQTELQAVQAETQALTTKLAQAREFYKTLDQKRAELRSLAQQLEQMKATLADTTDVPAFMKMVVIEAARVGLTVLGLKPTTSQTYDYYVEQAFDLQYRSVYPQLVVFLERLSNLETIIRVDNFNAKRNGPSTAQFVELNGVLELRTYRYRTSKADDIVKQNANPAASGAGTGTGAKPATPGAATAPTGSAAAPTPAAKGAGH
jgi:Tfp pilus assembly protein PilO